MQPIYTKESLLDSLSKIREAGWHASVKSAKNAGAVGNTLEHLLGIEENNLPLPNAAEWELKAQRKETQSLITLFHSEPSPRAMKIVCWLLKNFGWPHKEAGSRYPPAEQSFRQTISYKSSTTRGFKIDIDSIKNRIRIIFDSTEVNPELFGWKNSLPETALRESLRLISPIGGSKICFTAQARN